MASTSPAVPSSPLQHFRTPVRRRPLHPVENLLLWITCLHLVFLPWALGGVKLWAQLISLGFATLGLLVALLPRTYTADQSRAAPCRLYTWPKLLRFPLFWAGLLLLGYIVLQALNPAWVYTRDQRGWWMEPLSHLSWLPRGTSSPFHTGGPWRILLIYAAAWLLVCSIWIGFTRRRTVQLLFTVLAANGFALALFATIQRLAGNDYIYWLYRPENQAFFGSFIYKNHGGAYLLIVLAISVALAAWFYVRGLRRLEKSNPSGVFVFFAAVIGVNIVISYARAATIASTVFLALALIAYLVFQRRPGAVRKPVITVVLLVGFAFFLHTGLNALSAGKAWDRMGRLLEAHDVSVETRQVAAVASWDMFKANWRWGTGAGSFQFLFPYYQQHYPEIFAHQGRRLFWDHAHNDIIEIPVELGIFGLGVILFGLGYWVHRLARYVFWENAFVLFALLGALVLLAHSWTDFLFACPAILLTWCACWPAMALWAEFEEKQQGGPRRTASPHG